MAYTNDTKDQYGKSINDYKAAYAAAAAKGDAEGMAAANAGANAIRTANGGTAEYATADINNVKNGGTSGIVSNPGAWDTGSSGAFSYTSNTAKTATPKTTAAKTAAAKTATPVTTTPKTTTTTQTTAPVTSTGEYDWAHDTTDYSALMLGAKTAEEFLKYAQDRTNKAAAQGIDISGATWASNEDLYNQWYNTTGKNLQTNYKAADGSPQSGFYGMDGSGNWGYYDDAALTQKSENGNWDLYRSSDAGAALFDSSRGYLWPSNVRDTSRAGKTVVLAAGNNKFEVKYDENGYPATVINLNQGVGTLGDVPLYTAASLNDQGVNGRNLLQQTTGVSYAGPGASVSFDDVRGATREDYAPALERQIAEQGAGQSGEPENRVTGHVNLIQEGWPGGTGTQPTMQPVASENYADLLKELLERIADGQSASADRDAQYRQRLDDLSGRYDETYSAIMQRLSDQQAAAADRDAQYKAALEAMQSQYGDSYSQIMQQLADRDAQYRSDSEARQAQYQAALEARDAAAAQRQQETMDELRSLYDGQNSQYMQALADLQAANDAAVQRTTSALEGQKQSTNQSYADLFRQLYIDRMNRQKDIGQRLAAQGITGGAAESTLLGLGTQYEDALRQGEQGRLSAISELDRAIENARLTGDIATAQNAADLARENVSNYAQVLRDAMTQQNADRAYDYQRSRDAVSDQRYADQWAYQLGRDAVSDARYADEMGWNRAYQLGRDAVSDQRYADQWAYQMGRDAISDAQYADEMGWNRAYQLGRDAVSDARYADETGWNRAYQLGRDAISDARYADETSWNRNYQANRDAVSDARYNQQWAYQLQQDAYNQQQNAYQQQLAQMAAQAAASKPTLTAAQVNAAIKAGYLTNEVLSAYQYYYGAPYGSY